MIVEVKFGRYTMGSHLFQRVASFLQQFKKGLEDAGLEWFSSLSESGFIPTTEIVLVLKFLNKLFSSLSESGFIPTGEELRTIYLSLKTVLISFREWLHSYF